jgi:hypothetical protein
MSESLIQSNVLEFNEAMQKRVDKLGMAGEKVIKEQAGLLARTLIQLTPPSDVNQAKRRIEVTILRKVGLTRSGMVREEDFENRAYSSKQGDGDVLWQFSTPHMLSGTSREEDLRKLSVDQLYSRIVAADFNKAGMSRQGSRGKQAVRIKLQWLVKASTVHGVISKVKKHVGRLKAGWLPSWRILGAPEGGQGAVPTYILNHESKARGYYISNLGVKNHPSFTLVNHAQGATEENCGPTVRKALSMRAVAMMKDLALYIRGVKHVQN